MTPTRRATWLFWLFAVLILATGLGLRAPWPADEPRFALVARHMVESGNWLFPHRGSELYSDKPPLFMWMQAGLLWLTGNLRIAFLLPSLLAALGTLWCVVDLGSRLWTRRVGLYASWAVLLTVQFSWQALAAHPGVTDEAGAIEAAGLKPRLVRADVSNLNVTFPADLRLAELILQGRNS